MRFSVDPWDPAYGASVESTLEESEVVPVVDIEVPESQWAPIRPGPDTQTPASIVFVDGVRRIDARVWIDAGDDIGVPGICASFAAGAVRCDADAARIIGIEIGRGVYAPLRAVAAISTRHGPYDGHTTRDATPEALMYEVHACMSECEVQVAEQARRTSDDLIVVDGPLRKRSHIPDAVGFVKTHHKRYLGELDRVVGALPSGTRTPVFRVDAPPFSRYSWYLRLPGPAGGPWAGIVRCEASGALAPVRVVALADTVTAALGRFASEPHKDPRAPQNLYPIAGLERELRHRLGDPAVLYRALRRAAATVPTEAAAGIEPA